MLSNYSPIKSNNTLVLGGGGVTGIAWMTGLLHGLEIQGLDLKKFDRIIGTSAGATVAAQISTNCPLEYLYLHQVNPEQQVKEITPSINLIKIIFKFTPAFFARKNPIIFRQRIGKAALRSNTVSTEVRRQVILDRMPKHDWPDIQLDIMAVNAISGEIANFTKHSKVNFVDAVAASCAVPGIWPAVKINSEYYYDGGIRSGENADFAKGANHVLVISPSGLDGMSFPGSSLRAEIDLLEQTGSNVTLISPDSHSKNEMGKNTLDPSKRSVAAKAGKLQGSTFTQAAISSLWR